MWPLYAVGYLILCWNEGRWEAGQTLSRKLMLDLISAEQKGETLSVNSAFIEGIRSILTNSSLDKVSEEINYYLPSGFFSWSYVAFSKAGELRDKIQLQYLIWCFFRRSL
jgi:hypothetical protein